METDDWWPAQGETPSMEIPSSDWRSQLQPEARQRIVNKIMDTLRRHLPVAAPVGMTELKNIAVRFEEKIYAAAINQPDYLRKISLKILSMEAKIQQNTPMNSQNGVNQNSRDTGSLVIPPQVNCQGQPLPQIPLVGSPSGRHQILPQNLQNNTHASIQGISHSSVNNSLAQGTTTDIYANAQRHMQGRQQQQSQLMKKIHNNALLQPSMQQQQQSLLQTNLLQPSQQSKHMSQTQQQLQQPSFFLLQPQGQQSYQLSSQKHMMSQFQSQGQLQQPLAVQQQSNSMQMIPLSTLLQPQSAIEQQKQFMKSQRGIPEVSSSSSMDSTTQTGHNAADWQEEIYKKIQVMKEAHLAELQEFHQNISQRYHQVQSLSPTALNSAVSDISSVVSMIDRIAGSAPGNGSRASVGEDLVAMTKCPLQARNFMSQDGGTTTKKMKRRTSAMPLNNVSSAGSVNDNFMKFGSLDSFELESMATSGVKRRKLEVNHALHREIRAINQQLIDTVVSICDEDSDSAAAATSGGVGEGTIIECSFNAVSFSPSLKAHFASMHMCPIAPLRLLVPSNYPKCSPLLLDKLPIETSKEFEDPSIKAKSRFSISLRGLSQPISLGEMARTWDTCARKVIVEYVQQTGGGIFSSTYGAWENCVGA